MLKPRIYSHIVLELFLFAMISFFISCKKNYGPPANNNELKATVTFSSGTRHFLYALGNTAAMKCDVVGLSSEVYGSDGEGGVYFSLHDGCVTTPRTFDSLLFRYSVSHINSDSVLIYSNRNLRSPGATVKHTAVVTFTVVSDDYWEGHFNAVGWTTSQTDSVVVTGTFKGKKRK